MIWNAVEAGIQESVDGEERRGMIVSEPKPMEEVIGSLS
ncbi:unnamed protein product, partial [marine sediment metagenome]